MRMYERVLCTVGLAELPCLNLCLLIRAPEWNTNTELKHIYRHNASISMSLSVYRTGDRVGLSVLKVAAGGNVRFLRLLLFIARSTYHRLCGADGRYFYPACSNLRHLPIDPKRAT